jgi:hypothetical protein
MAGYWQEEGGSDRIPEAGNPTQPYTTIHMANGDTKVYRFIKTSEGVSQTNQTPTPEALAKEQSILGTVGSRISKFFLKSDEELAEDKRMASQEAGKSQVKEEITAKQRRALAGFGRRGLEVFGGMNFDEKGRIIEDARNKRRFEDMGKDYSSMIGATSKERYESNPEAYLNKFNLPREPVRDFMDMRQQPKPEGRGVPTLGGFQQRSDEMNCYRDRCFGEPRGEMPTLEGFEKKMNDKKKLFGF